MKRVLLVFALGACLSACGSKTPTTPTTTTPTPTGISVSGDTGFRTGQSRQFSANVTLSNGTSQAATSPNWTSTNTTVATVSGDGTVTAVNQGNANIAVTAQGMTTSQAIQVWQDYQGTWTGVYVLQVCTNSGGFSVAGWCALAPVGSVLPFRFTLTQTNGSASGTLELGSLIGSIKGAIFDTRRFVGTATLSQISGGTVFTSTVGTFSVLSTGSSLGGNLVVNTTANNISGNGYWEANLGTVVRSLISPPFDAHALDRLLNGVAR